MNHEQIQVGDFVRAKNGHTLHCGSGIYEMAVVVDLEPLILVSRFGDMMWSKCLISDIEPVGFPADANSLLHATKRYINELKRKLPPAER